MAQDDEIYVPPDTLAQAALRHRWTEELRERHGDEYIERHAALLDLEWEYLKVCHFID